MAVTAASLAVRFSAEGASQTRKEIESVGTAVDNAEAKRKMLGAGLLSLGAGIVGGFGYGIQAAVSFESAMQSVVAVTGATGESFAQLSDLALEIGADTAFSATEAASAIEELAKAGVSVEDILLGAADGATALAAAAGTSLPNAASAIANSLNIFSLSGDQAIRVANVFAAAANKSATDVDQLSAGLAQGGAGFAMYGLSVEQAVAMLAMFSDYGIRGSDAATSINAALRSLTSGVGASGKAVAELGLNLYSTSGEFLGMDNLASELQRTLGGLTEEERNLYLTQLGGADGMRALNILYKEGASGVTEYTDAVTGTDAASQAAKVRMDSVAGAIESLKGSVETLFITYMTRLLPAIRFVVDGLTGFTNILTALPDGVQTAIVAFTGLAGIVATLGGAFLLFGPQVIAAFKILRTLSFAGMIAGLGPFLPILLGIGAAAGGLYLAYKTDFLGFATAIDGFVDRLQDAWRVVSGPSNVMDRINEWGGIAAAGAEYTNTLSRAFSALGIAIRGIAGGDSGFFNAIADGLEGLAGITERFLTTWTSLGDSSVMDRVNAWGGIADANTEKTSAWERSLTSLSTALRGIDGGNNRLANIVAETLDWANFIGPVIWEGWITILDWAVFVAPVIWDGWMVILDWATFIAKVSWDGWMTVLDWTLFIAPFVWDFFVDVLDWTVFLTTLAWDTFVYILDWTVFIGMLAWDSFVIALDWGIFIASFLWSGFITALDWATYIVALSWNLFVTAVDLAVYVSSLVWDTFVTAVDLAVLVGTFAWKTFVTAVDLTTYVVSLVWDTFVTAVDLAILVGTFAWETFVTGVDLAILVGTFTWEAFVTAVDLAAAVGVFAWSTFVTAVDMAAKVGVFTWSAFVTAVDLAAEVGAFVWSAFVTGVDLAAKVGAFAWSTFVTAVDLAAAVGAFAWSTFVTAVDLAAGVGAFAWETFITAVDLAAKVGAFAWSTFVTAVDLTKKAGALAWSSFVTAIDLGVKVGAFTWGTFITAVDLTKKVASLAWSGFVTAIDLTKKVASFAWSSFVTAVDLAAKVGAFAWSTFVTALDAWSDFIADLSWSSFVPSVSWSDWIPDFPGWDSLFGGGGGGDPDSTDNLDERGEYDWENRRPGLDTLGPGAIARSNKVDVDITDALAKIQTLKDAIAGLGGGGLSALKDAAQGGGSIRIAVDTTDALAKITGLKDAIAGIGGGGLGRAAGGAGAGAGIAAATITVDTSAAISSLNNLKTAIDDTQLKLAALSGGGGGRAAGGAGAGAGAGTNPLSGMTTAIQTEVNKWPGIINTAAGLIGTAALNAGMVAGFGVVNGLNTAAPLITAAVALWSTGIDTAAALIGAAALNAGAVAGFGMVNGLTMAQPMIDAAFLGWSNGINLAAAMIGTAALNAGMVAGFGMVNGLAMAQPLIDAAFLAWPNGINLAAALIGTAALNAGMVAGYGVVNGLAMAQPMIDAAYGLWSAGINTAAATMGAAALNAGAVAGFGVANGIGSAQGSINGAVAAWTASVNGQAGPMGSAGLNAGSVAGYGAANGIASAQGQISGNVSVWPGIINGIAGSMGSAGLNAGAAAGYGVANGLASAEGSVQAAANRIAAVVASTMALRLLISSPSKVTERLGAFAGEGLAKGILGSEGKVVAAATQVVKRAQAAARLQAEDGSWVPKSFYTGNSPLFNQWKKLFVAGQTSVSWTNYKNQGMAAGTAFGNGVAAGARSSLKINSPSRVLSGMGVYAAQGFMQGFEGAYQSPRMDFAPQMPTVPLSGSGGTSGLSGSGGATTIHHHYHTTIHAPVTVEGNVTSENALVTTVWERGLASLVQESDRRDVAMGVGR